MSSPFTSSRNNRLLKAITAVAAWCLLVLSLSNVPLTNGFVPPILSSSNHHQHHHHDGLVSQTHPTTTTVLFATSSTSSSLPTIEQLSKDKFMDQVNYGSEITNLLIQGNGDDEKLLTDMITAQLSHSDGIRGFFVSYLTGDTEDGSPHPADNAADSIPKPVRDAIVSSIDGNKSELISLACMNVIMPTAMTSMHVDDNLAQSSSKTAKRGMTIAKLLMSEPEMIQQCQAILQVAKDDYEEDTDDKDIKYWIEFFDKWGYGSEQKKDIANAMDDMLSS